MTLSPQGWQDGGLLADGLRRIPPSSLVLVGLILLLLITWIDYATGTEVSFSIFYLLPVTLLTWQLGRTVGLVFAILSSVAWLLADTLPGEIYSHPAVPAWNALVRFGFFLITVLVLASFREALAREKTWARSDALTGLANGRHFREILQEELLRSRRYAHPVSLAYMDLDNFKSVNDRLGHAAGDELLKDIGALLRSNSRSSDTPARLAGDEFALLMPETGEDMAHSAVERVRYQVAELMQNRGWEVSSSIGLVTYLVPPESCEAALKVADSLMYSAKKEGKNRVVARVEPRGDNVPQSG